jgi:hypothetical protein
MTTNDAAPPRTGRFTPTLEDLGGFEWDGVPVCEISDDVLIALTINRVAAVQALNAYLVLALGVHDAPIYGRDVTLRYGIGVFEWEPEDAELPWTVRLVPKHDDTTVHLHHITL